ncbi:MAG: 7-cyano-7-deazaguanine synthase QueC [Nitrospinae bacterium]|nr:7-cyano-7-deazaguanine synthase QueC [Nitrospinota bacterium]
MTLDKIAVVLLSGGADSATALACAKRDGFAPYALTIDYGQRHRVELEMARRQAQAQKAARHLIMKIDLRGIGKSALTDDVPVPVGRTPDEISEGIPATYVPARNTIFLSVALGWAESLGTGDVYVGVNALDYSGYPDCRPEYIEAFEKMARLATKMGVEGRVQVKIHAPLISRKKSEIFLLGRELGVDFSMTSSCYDPSPDGVACGVCDSCALRLKGFAEAGLTDPLRYAKKI